MRRGVLTATLRLRQMTEKSAPNDCLRESWPIRLHNIKLFLPYEKRPGSSVFAWAIPSTRVYDARADLASLISGLIVREVVTKRLSSDANIISSSFNTFSSLSTFAGLLASREVTLDCLFTLQIFADRVKHLKRQVESFDLLPFSVNHRVLSLHHNIHLDHFTIYCDCP